MQEPSIRFPGVFACLAALSLGCGDDGGRPGATATAGAVTTLSTTSPGTDSTDSGAASEPTTGGSAGDSVTDSSTADPLTGGPTSTTASGPVCGDGVQDIGEDCDLGTLNGPDHGCSTNCTVLPTSCGVQEAGAELVPEPVDIIITIDNSGSMGGEILGVQNNINDNFAQILGDSGLDYRVILVSRFGSVASESVCIEAPLSGIPQGGCANPPAMPVNSDRFFHYSLGIDSIDSWCRLLGSYNGAEKDKFGLAPGGWSEWLRPEAFKVFLEITDDAASCSIGGSWYFDGGNVNSGQMAATTFDLDLLAKDPLAFGAAPESRNYKWYSLVGLAYNQPPEAPYTPNDPIVTGTCPSAESSGTGYQALSNMTGGMRFPLCDTTKYDVMFQEIAAGVVSDAKLSCEFEIPDPPEGKSLDESSIVVLFTPSGQMNPIILTQVPSPDLCDAMSFYVENGMVILCPEACALAQDDKGAQLTVEFSCEPLAPG